MKVKLFLKEAYNIKALLFCSEWSENRDRNYRIRTTIYLHTEIYNIAIFSLDIIYLNLDIECYWKK